jgi:hypothetical protein
MSAAGTEQQKTPLQGTTNQFNFPAGESVTCVAKYLDYEAPTVNIQVSVQGLWFLDLRRHLRLCAQRCTAAGTLQPCVITYSLQRDQAGSAAAFTS